MTTQTRRALLCVSMLVLPSCQSPPATEKIGIRRPLPYRIYLYVDESSAVSPEDANTETGSDSSRTLRVNLRNVETELAASGRELCTEIVVLDVNERNREAALEEAQQRGVDLFLEIDSRDPPEFTSHRNAWFLPNTMLWFVLGFPSFWVKDRVYDVRWPVRLNVQPSGEEESIRLEDPVALNVSERGFSAKALYTPPGFYDGPYLSDKLARHAEKLLVAGVKRVLREDRLNLSTWGSRIEILSPENHSAVPADGTEVSVRITGEPAPEILRIEFDDRILLEHGAITGRLDRRSAYTWTVADILDGFADFESREGRQPVEWSATKTVFFTTDDGLPHRLRVLVRTSALAGHEPATP